MIQHIGMSHVSSLLRVLGTRKSTILALVFLPWIARAQTSSDPAANRYPLEPSQVISFADFLATQGNCGRAITEYQRHLFLAPGVSPGDVHYKIGNCHLLSDEPRLAARSFLQAQSLSHDKPRRDSAYVARLGALLLADEHHRFAGVLSDASNSPIPTSLSRKVGELETLSYLAQADWDQALANLTEPDGSANDAVLHLELYNLAIRGSGLSGKSELLAGLMSSILPGSGKWYAGRFSDGLYSLALIGGTVWMAYEGFQDHGIRSAKGWLFSGLGFTIYAGNIYGSVVAVRVHNASMRTELMNEIRNYISISARL